jgi:hypothetical protein
MADRSQRRHSTVGDGGTDRQEDDVETRRERAGAEPPSSASVTTVVPFGEHEVPAGDWIVHALSYVQETDQQDEAAVKRDLEQFLDRVDSAVRIDGEPVEQPGQYWVGPQEVDDGRWGVEWRYATPPKPAGTEHTFELSWTFDPPFEPFDGEDTFPRIESPGCTYRIVDDE